jgi:hypothetical protein
VSGSAGGSGLLYVSKSNFCTDRGKGGETGETGEEFDLFNNSHLTGLTGLPDRTPFHIEGLRGGKKR